MKKAIDPDWKAEDTITPQEEVLAWHLKNHVFNFVRQFEVHRPGQERSYWLDFAWPDKKVAVEIDGHPINLEREAFLTDLGWRILHLQNEHFSTRKEQRATLEYVVSILIHYLKKTPHCCDRCGRFLEFLEDMHPDRRASFEEGEAYSLCDRCD